MRKCVILCYFGQLPNYFELYLDSCKHNFQIDWIFITDNKLDIDAENVKIVNYTYEDFKKRVQKCFDFPVALDSPYKWCDFRPAIAYIFPEIVSSYDYWGFCDCDLIWGNLSKFYPDTLIGQFDRFLVNGHLQFYKNTKEINELFMVPIYAFLDYKAVFKSKLNYGFDEIGRISINKITNKVGKSVYDNRDEIADIYPYGDKFISRNKEIDYIKIDRNLSGGVFQVSEENEKEVAYVHFQKRKLIFDADIDFNRPIYVKYNSMTNDVFKMQFIHPKEIIMPPNFWMINKNRCLRAWEIVKNTLY